VKTSAEHTAYTQDGFYFENAADDAVEIPVTTTSGLHGIHNSLFGPGVDRGSLNLGDVLECFGELRDQGAPTFSQWWFMVRSALVRPTTLCLSSSVSMSRNRCAGRPGGRSGERLRCPGSAVRAPWVCSSRCKSY
jgi:hypothetical protein